MVGTVLIRGAVSVLRELDCNLDRSAAHLPVHRVQPTGNGYASRHSGPRLLLIAAADPLAPLEPASSARVTSEKRKRRTRSLDLRADDHSNPRNCQMIGRATITSMTWMILRTIPLIALPVSPA